MNPQDSTSGIRFTPQKGSAYQDEGKTKSKSFGNPSSTRDFKKVLDEDPDKDKGAVEDELEKATAELVQGMEADTVHSKQESKKKPIASLFSLANPHAKETKEQPEGALPSKQGAVGDALEDKPGNQGVLENKPDNLDALKSKPDNRQEGFLAANQQKTTLPPPPHAKAETPPALHVKQNAPHQPEPQKITDAGSKEEEAAIAFAPKNEEDEGAGKVNSEYLRQQPDLSSILTVKAGESSLGEVASGKTEMSGPSRLLHIQEIVDQIVSKLYTVSVEGRTDTTIVLKQPPLLEGATVIISAYDNAKGQFNITFENLTQQAKQVLDLAQNRNSLLDALERKGYAVQMMTTTTIIENTVLVKDSPTPGRDQQGQQGSQDQGRQGSRNDRDEEKQG